MNLNTWKFENVLRLVVLCVLVGGLAFLNSERASAQISYSASGSTYTQNFDNLLSNPAIPNTTPVPASVLPPNWTFVESGANANTTLRVDNGSSGTGDTFLYGATGSNERAFGSYASGSLTSIFGASFVNNTGITLTSFTLSYTGEQWKDGGSAQAILNDSAFSYGLGNASITAGTFTPVTGLDLKAVVNNTTADKTLDGNSTANQTNPSTTVTGISWAPGQVLFIRWSDLNDPGNDDGLAVDNVSFSAVGASDTTPPQVSTITRLAGSPNPTSATSVNFTVTFSEAVTGVDTTDFTPTSTGTIAGATVSNVTGNGTTYTVTVSGYTGTGTIRLDLTDNDSILDSASNPLGGTGAGNGSFTTGDTFTVSAATGALIGEFRAHGSSGATDEYIELANSTTSALDISGWSVKYLSGGTLVTATVPANTTLVPLGHYLFTGSGYNATLSGISGSDQTLASPMDDATGITLLNAGSTVVDAVSFAGSSMAGEGTLLPSAPTADGEYAFERRQSSGNPAGVPLDNNNNSGDFIFVSTTGGTLASVTGDGTTATTLASTLGAPSPNSTTGYVQTGSVALSLLDTSVANTASPNRVRLNAVDSGVVGAPDRFGTLRLRRTLTNNGSTTYTRVRFHVVTITTLNGGGYSDPTQADVRLLTSPDETGAGAITTSTGAKNVIGTSVQVPSTGTMGGGLNANTVVLNQALTPGSSANYSFELGVARKGNFLVGFTIELLP